MSASPHLKGVFSIALMIAVQDVVDVVREGEEARVLGQEEVMSEDLLPSTSIATFLVAAAVTIRDVVIVIALDHQ